MGNDGVSAAAQNRFHQIVHRLTQAVERGRRTVTPGSAMGSDMGDGGQPQEANAPSRRLRREQKVHQ